MRHAGKQENTSKGGVLAPNQTFLDDSTDLERQGTSHSDFRPSTAGSEFDRAGFCPPTKGRHIAVAEFERSSSSQQCRRGAESDVAMTATAQIARHKGPAIRLASAPTREDVLQLVNSMNPNERKVLIQELSRPQTAASTQSRQMQAHEGRSAIREHVLGESAGGQRPLYQEGFMRPTSRQVVRDYHRHTTTDRQGLFDCAHIQT